MGGGEGGREGGRGQGLFHALSLMVKIFGLHCIIVSGSDSKSFFCYYILDYASQKIYYKTYPCICQFVKDCFNYAQSVLFDILLVVKQMVILLSNAPERMKINIYHNIKNSVPYFYHCHLCSQTILHHHNCTLSHMF